MALQVSGHELLHMGRHTFMWVDAISFNLDGESSDRAVLTALVASPGYTHDYASPFDPKAAVSEPAVHGKWWRSCVSAESFAPCASTEAQAVLQDWADNQDWTEPEYQQPPEAQANLERVYQLLRTGSLFRLVNPGEESVHGYGFVVGNCGFHEFVVIDRDSHTVRLIVASDD